MRKTVFILLPILFSATFSHGQFYRSILPSPEFSTAFEKIVVDFRLNFATIQGNSVEKTADTETYESTVKLPGAIDCIINV